MKKRVRIQETRGIQEKNHEPGRTTQPRRSSHDSSRSLADLRLEFYSKAKGVKESLEIPHIAGRE